MRILVLGSGGREHALVWKLRQSPRATKVYCAPGNGGIAYDAECFPADLKSLDSLVAVARRLRPDLTVVGPELPLTLGVVDEFTRRGWPVFGPTKTAAQLESSKSFAKEFLQRHHIATAHYAICDSVDEVRAGLPHFHPPVVVKADGLAAGKGVVIAQSKEEAVGVAAEMLSGKMVGEAGSRVVLEECLKGDELSFLVLSDGERVAPLVAAQVHNRDHRRQNARLAYQPYCAPRGRGHEGRGGGIQRLAVLRPYDDRAWSHGAGVQLPLWRSGDAADSAAAGERSGRGSRSFHRRPG